MNCSVTIGPPFCPKSARVPDSTRSAPVISGIGPAPSCGRDRTGAGSSRGRLRRSGRTEAAGRRWQETTIRCAGTLSTSVPAAPPPYGLRSCATVLACATIECFTVVVDLRLRALLRRLRRRRDGLVAEEVVRLGRPLRAGLYPLQEAVERRRGERVAVRVVRRADEVVLEVEQHELRGLADQLRGRGGVVHAGELDHDLVAALLADLGLGHAELVDAVLHDRDRTVEVVGRELVALRRMRP